ncbi:gluconate 2-dehydrogenase subunit 3 family protein [Pseudofrankia inefficax]|uniref:Gluconate 2-dehydrogenase subunit 3 n=1 Tax=Pseudofrankia inefficax (strain DSM 45817 / CECT 9037 / DDB 130130 / EuI1c) TaxID=298654 RepID=E3J8I2_PSEI1|nr:gluconate 2-dehydrogenase subunit 3 family protein [Pseudofrankia inefficax]ADP84516.1 hypothetical protein FraEuI1c_6540 [Pseudofrankia inefficax]
MPFRAPDQHGVTPQRKGRFPGFNVLDSVDAWDDVTAGVVLHRLVPPADLTFFTPPEAAIAGRLLDLLLAQDGEPRVPVLALVDGRLAAGETDGWHYDDLPQDAQAWRDTLGFLDADARDAHGLGFAELDEPAQAAIIQAVQDRTRDGQDWHRWAAARSWSLWTRYACTAFYSHPWAWNEIGFPGPAYPRGYLNPGVNAREHWEVAEQDALDPVPFAARVERERHEHQRLLTPEESP